MKIGHRRLPTDPPPPPMSERPLCPGCGKRLRPYINEDLSGKWDEPRKRAWNGRWDAYGMFCTMICAVDFANAAYKAGYRLKDGGAAR